MRSTAQRVLAHIRRHELLHAGDRVGVAVSGGIDSVALLRLFLELRQELGIVLSVVHFNHKLRGAESDSDQEFVASLARKHGLEFHSDADDVAAQAADEHISVETAARQLRYGFFRCLLGEDSALDEPNSAPRLDKVATGHTLDDQAETVLMRLIRGTGLRGLGGIHPRILVEGTPGELCGEIVRPLLQTSRSELEQYLTSLQQPWREDASNADIKFTRNRVRRLLLPILEREFNPALTENLGELAEIARGEEDYWDNEVSGWFGTVIQWSEPDWARDLERRAASFVQIEMPDSERGRCVPLDPDLRSRITGAPWLVMNAAVNLPWLLAEPAAVQRRALKAIGEHARIPLEFKHVEEILRFAAEHRDCGKELSLPLGWKAVREPDALAFLTPDLRQQPSSAEDYEYELPVPGRLSANETLTIFEALQINPASQPHNLDDLLDAGLLPKKLTVRNWRPGDRFWPAHTKSPKKIKELLQERHVPAPERKIWPVVVSGDEIVWLRGFPAPAKFQAKPGRNALLIREIPLAQAGDIEG